MTLTQKMVAAAVGILLVALLAISGLGGSEGTVNSVKALMGLNPLAEQELVPLPGGVSASGERSAAGDSVYVDDDDSEMLSSVDVEGDKVAATVLSIVSDNASITVPDGENFSEVSEPIYLDDHAWD